MARDNCSLRYFAPAVKLGDGCLGDRVLHVRPVSQAAEDAAVEEEGRRLANVLLGGFRTRTEGRLYEKVLLVSIPW